MYFIFPAPAARASGPENVIGIIDRTERVDNFPVKGDIRHWWVR
jgi:hypothetical protein